MYGLCVSIAHMQFNQSDITWLYVHVHSQFLSHLSYRRVDDLQFQLEEQAIISRDELEEASSREQEELSQLKTDLQLEKERTSSLTEQVCLIMIPQTHTITHFHFI